MFGFIYQKKFHFLCANLCGNSEHCFYCVHSCDAEGCEGVGFFKYAMNFYYACDTVFCRNSDSSSEFFRILLIPLVMPNICCSHQKESELETQDASDQDGNDELKDFKESVEDENLNSKELPSAEKKRYHDLEPAETTEDAEKDSESQVLCCILHVFLPANCSVFVCVCITRKSELVFQFLAYL